VDVARDGVKRRPRDAAGGFVMKRRVFLQCCLAGVGSGVLVPHVASAREFDPFQATSVDTAFEALSLASPQASAKIDIEAPKVAEDGAKVPIRIVSNIPGTTEILTIISGNPKPLAARYRFGKKATAAVSSRIKMAKTSDLIAVVKADDSYYVAKTEIKVTLGGCGG
jgi:sulfur-oxidizing protein SoxY